MNFKEKAQRAAADVALTRILRYVEKNPERNLLRLVDITEQLVGKVYPIKNFDKFRQAVSDKDNVWRQLMLNVIRDTDPNIVKKMLLALGLGAAVNGTKAVRANRDKYNCNIPWIILLDPTSACNLRCTGCWAAEYGHKQSLTFEEMESIVCQGVELGVHFYMFTGGEPLVRKKDILKLCRNHPDCAFLAYTNSTLIDEPFCREVREVGNLTFAISLEGNQKINDSRRGEGTYDKIMQAMKLLKAYKILFGLSVCYTSANVESVTSDEFIQKILKLGAKFALYFNYMPVGHEAVADLIPTPAQREHMYNWLRKTRDAKEGNPLFVMDFQNDAEYVGGCIAGGRNYFHINSAGDIEPCVFIHYSDSNIRTHTLLQALKNPLFQAYYHNQPFNDNHLRPCPMLENPDCLRKMIRETGAKSTDLVVAEDVEILCSRCDKFAKAWAPEADRIWNSTKHPSPKTRYYRDTPEGKEVNQA